MLTGRRLFLRDSAAETASALVRAPITPCSTSRPEVPGELDEIIQSALTRDLAQRLPSAEALRVALERFLSARSSFSTTTLLGEFVRDLFGAERAQERIQLGSTPQSSDIAEASAVEGTPMLSRVTGVTTNEARTILASPEEVAALVKRPRRRAPLFALGALVVAGGAFALWRYGPPPSAPVAVTPPPDPAPPVPVAVTPSEPAPAPSPPTVEAPESPPTHSAAPRHRDPGWLSVDSNVAARASLDGTALGALPLSHVRVPAGEHRLKVENPSLGLSRTVRLRVASGETLEHHAAVTLGTLNVTVSPWADVYLDGFHLGQTPLAGREVAAAPHQLRLVGPNGEKTLQIDLKQNETRVVRETLP
jgi:serine/threonine-protein kinase